MAIILEKMESHQSLFRRRIPILRGYKIIGISPLTKIRPMLIYC